MLDLIIYTLIVACADAFFITLAYKWRVIEWLQVHADQLLSKIIRRDTDLLYQLFSCNFCMSWWMSWVFTAVLFAATKDPYALLTPFLATPISKKLL